MSANAVMAPATSPVMPTVTSTLVKVVGTEFWKKTPAANWLS